jgi:hypothetical protein
VFYAGGGGGRPGPSAGYSPLGTGGNGGGGGWGAPGTANTGGGGGAIGGSGSATGGSGVVIISYPDTRADLASIGGGLSYTRTVTGGNKIYTFTSGTGTIQW